MTLNQPFRSSQLVDSFGVATHLSYTNGGYRELSTTTDALRYLGIDKVRDDVPNPAWDPYGQAHFPQAAAAGIDFAFFANGAIDPATLVSRIHAIEQAAPGSITVIEGPNEVNNWPVNHKGQGGTAGAQSYMRDLFDAVQADPVLRDIPVSGFTDYPNHASVSDASTIHSYSKNGNQPQATLRYDMAAQEAVDPGKPFYITETGYHTQINASGGGWEGVSEAVQAKLVLNTYMDGALLGAKQTYIYQLLDAYPGNSQEEHFGLFRLDNSPKPAATAIRNLTAILDDQAGNAGSFGTSSLDVTVTNAPANSHTLLAEKSNGTFQLITWAEPDIWNEDANQEINVSSTTETISFDRTFQKIEIFDPLVGTSPIRSFSDTNTVNVDVTDHPLIIQLSGA
ncbi:MAG: calcium-binding protein, partial [Pseudomonadota bacterium]